MTFSFIILLLCVLLPVTYAAFLLGLMKGWFMPVFPKRRRPLAEGIKVSVVVALRNEASQLATLFSSFQHQTYSSSLIEYILVNDHSEDGSVEEILKLSHILSVKVLLIHLDAGVTGKKAAISKAIGQASGDLVITTDADCSAGPEWISTIVDYYRFHDCRMIAGGVKYISAPTLWSRLQQVEFQTLIGTGACMVGLGYPAMSNGANLAYERSAFTDLGGYKGTPETASGDDLFLMYRLHKLNPGKIHYLHRSEAYVSTLASPDFQTFIQQRKRWAGKWSYYALPWAKALPVGLFFFYFILLFTWISALLTLSWPVFLLSFIVKAVSDRLWLIPVTREAGIRVSVSVWILLSFLYPFYAVFFGIFSKMGRYRWKGRELSS